MKNLEAQYQPLLTTAEECPQSPSDDDDNDEEEEEGKESLPTLNRLTKKKISKCLFIKKRCSSSGSAGALILCAALLALIFIACYYLLINVRIPLVDISRHARWKSLFLLTTKLPVQEGNDEPTASTVAGTSLSEQYHHSLNEAFRKLFDQLNSTTNSATSTRHKVLSSFLPKRIQLNESQTMALVEAESNLAASYWARWKMIDAKKGLSPLAGAVHCAGVSMISPHQARMSNLYWQVTESTETSLKLFLYNAYYDDRLWARPQVKVITATDRQVQVERLKWWCLLWFENLKAPVLSNISEVYTIFPEYWSFGVAQGVYGPQVFTCDIPPAYAKFIPQAVSVQSTGECGQMEKYPDNVLRVIYNQRNKTLFSRDKPNKPSIGVCVQAFRFGTYDVSVRLVEWLEMVKLMGADQVYFYVFGATDGMMKVLRHYEAQKFVDWRTLTLPGEYQPNDRSLYNFYYQKIKAKFWPEELIELNDCLYRNIHRHDYLAVIDIDEVPLPQKTDNWHELLQSATDQLSEQKQQRTAYFENRHAYVYEMFEDTEMPKPNEQVPIPEYLYMFRHVNRVPVFSPGLNIKCFHRTDQVFAVHNHFPMRCINTTGHHSCTGMTFDPSESILMHYRRNVPPPTNCSTPDNLKECTVRDTNVWRFFDQVAARVKSQLLSIFVS